MAAQLVALSADYSAEKKAVAKVVRLVELWADQTAVRLVVSSADLSAAKKVAYLAAQKACMWVAYLVGTKVGQTAVH